MTNYTYTTERYGPLPWQTMLVGRSTSVATDKWAYVYVPGGGWGIRDAVPFLSIEGPGGIVYPVRPCLYAGAFDNTSDSPSSYLDSATVFVLNVASESSNGPAINVHHGTYTGDYYPDNTPGPAPTAWVSGANYAVNDVVCTGNTTAICKAAHNSSIANSSPQLDNNGDPGSAADDYWSVAYSECPAVGRFPNRGELTSAGGIQSAADVQRAISYIRRNYESYGIDRSKVLLEGSSAGGQAAGLAAYSPPLNYGHEVHPTAQHQYGVESDCRPNGLILDIAACQQDNYAQETGRAAAQAFFLSIVDSLFVQTGGLSQSKWASIPASQRRSLDPYWAAYTSGYYVPTYLMYEDDEGYDDPWTYDDIANGLVPANFPAWSAVGGDYVVGDKVASDGYYWVCSEDHDPSVVSAPEGNLDVPPYWKNSVEYQAPGGVLNTQIHHSQNGRKYMEEFTKSPSFGGMGIPDGASGYIRLCVRKPGDIDNRRVFHTYSATGDTAGTFSDITMGTGDVDDKNKPLADDILSFFSTGGVLDAYI